MVQAQSLMAHIFGVKKGWFGGQRTDPLLGHNSQPLNATKDTEELGCYLHPEKETLPKGKTASGNARRETEAQRSHVACRDILGFSQGLRMGESFYNLKHLL